MSDYVNKIRLSNYEAESYYNSGVLLMNLPQMREEMRPADIFAYAREYEERADPAGPGHPQRPVRHPDPGCGRQCVEL